MKLRSPLTCCLFWLSALALVGCGTPGGNVEVESEDKSDTQVVAADSAHRTSFYVHLVSGADPVAVARRHGLVPSDTITGPRPGFVAKLTAREQAALKADSAVRSLAREIHQGKGRDAPVIREIGVDSGGS